MITFYDSITGGRTLLDTPPPDISYHAPESLQEMNLVETCGRIGLLNKRIDMTGFWTPCLQKAFDPSWKAVRGVRGVGALKATLRTGLRIFGLEVRCGA